MTKWNSRFVVVCACLLASASVSAHHSLAGVYALGKEAKITQAFKAFRLINPHSALKVDVKGANGASVEWNILGGSVEQLARLGIGKSGPNALKAGDEITVTIMPRSTARVRLDFWWRSPTRTGTRSVSALPMNSAFLTASLIMLAGGLASSPWPLSGLAIPPVLNTSSRSST